MSGGTPINLTGSHYVGVLTNTKAVGRVGRAEGRWGGRGSDCEGIRSETNTYRYVNAGQWLPYAMKGVCTRSMKQRSTVRVGWSEQEHL